MNNNIDYELLNDLTDQELLIVSENTDLEMLLEPIKQNSKKYARQCALLGRLKEKSLLVKKNLPGIAVDLYKKNDVNFSRLFAISINNLKKVMGEIIASEFDGQIALSDLNTYSANDYINILSQIDGKPGNHLDIELFFLQARLNGITISNETKAKIRDEWYYIQETKKLNNENQREIERIKKEQESLAKEQIKAEKQQYSKSLAEVREDQKKLEADINAKQQVIASLIQENSEKDNQIENIKEQLHEIKRANEELLQENTSLNQDVIELNIKLSDEKEKLNAEWLQQWKKNNDDILKQNEELSKQAEKFNQELLDKKKESAELELSLEQTQKLIDQYMGTLQGKLEKKSNDTDEHQTVFREKIVESDKCNLWDTLLYIEKGNLDTDLQECETYADYQDIVESNLSEIGCKMRNEMLQDFTSSSMNAGLYPLFCGFGSRKAALAICAARYGEKATIISVPNAFSNTTALESAIVNAPTNIIIIEDLFGKMLENIILPIIRRFCGKQIVFCCEDIQELKYVDNYFYNYFQIIKVNRMSLKREYKLLYCNATSVFHDVDYDNKTEGHKVVRQLLDAVMVSDAYIISRGNMISYMTQKLQHSMEDTLSTWFEDELKIILDDEQRQKIIDVIEANPAKFSKSLAERL